MNPDQDPSPVLPISRRRLLQLLAASGAALAAEKLLPADWIRPAASASPAAPDPLIGDLAFFWQPYNTSYAQGTVRFRYYDALADVNNSSLLYAQSSQGVVANGLPLFDTRGQAIPYTAMNGTIRFPLSNPSPVGFNEGVKLYITAATDPGRTSNGLVGASPVYNNSVKLSPLSIANQAAANGSCGLPVVRFTYNSSAPNAVSNSTYLYAWQNSAGWISAGGPISNMSGTVLPDSPTSGEVYFPIQTVNSSLPFELSLFLEDESYAYDTAVASGIYAGCDSLAITSFTQQLCGPWVQDGRIGCRHDLMIGYKDDKAQIGPDARLSIEYDGQRIVDDETLADLGLSVSDPAAGTLYLPVLLPEQAQNGLAHPLRAVLRNEDGDSSAPAETLVDQFCAPSFPLVLNTTAAYLVNNSTTQWRITAAFNDSAGLVGNSSLLTAVLNSAGGGLRTLYNGVPLATVGAAYINGLYDYYPGAVNCSVLPINGSIGSLAFNVNTNGGQAGAAPDKVEATPEPVTLSWFLTEPPGRDAEAPAILLDPEVEPPEEPLQNFMPIVRA